MRSFCHIGLGCVVLLSLGCGDSGPPLVSVKGHVFLDEKPLVGKTLRFIPEMGTPGQGAGATTDAVGSYELLAVRPGTIKDIYGVPPGTYRVVVTEPMFPLELPGTPAAEPDAPAPAIGLPDSRPRKSSIPARYTSADHTPLKVEITEGGKVDLRLTSDR